MARGFIGALIVSRNYLKRWIEDGGTGAGGAASDLACGMENLQMISSRREDDGSFHATVQVTDYW